MKLELYIPKLEDYWYEKQLNEDEKTMSYNAGYDVSYQGYNYDTGVISFPKERWKIKYEKRIKERMFFAYIKDTSLNEFVGYCNYQLNKELNRYECGVVIEASKRGRGYSKKALKLLCETAFKNGVEELYDNFEKDRENTLKVFKDVGFKIIEETKWKKFGKDVNGVTVFINKELFMKENEKDSTKIIEYEDKYLDDVKDLLVELEKYIISIDKDNLDRLHPDYRDKMAIIDLEEVKNNNGKCYIAVENGKAIGLIMGYVRKYEEYDYLDYKCPKSAIISELIVSKKVRSTGIGRLLMDKMEKYFKSIGCKYVFVDVFAYNENGFNFYNKNGYHERMKTLLKKID